MGSGPLKTHSVFGGRAGPAEGVLGGWSGGWEHTWGPGNGGSGAWAGGTGKGSRPSADVVREHLVRIWGPRSGEGEERWRPCRRGSGGPVVGWRV